ncbi:prolyl oligopeptidase family serine peptidase [Nonomuraea sp. NPDC051941]|uniref:prolyl oligopeptidase family serine peptidase n=1 Tax=Nonomuraea sp. NPDC051941 TaxID=3364373 RepID=UPI0037C52F4B
MSARAYPPARRGEDSDVVHGRVIPDPYRWLEGDGAESRRWLRAQHELTEGYLRSSRPRPFFADLLDRLMTPGTDSAPVWRGTRAYFLSRRPGQEHAALYCRDDGGERVVFDPARLGGPGSAGATLDSWSLSSTGRLLACQVSRDGTEQGVLLVADLVSGEIVDGPIGGVRYPTVAWLPDESAFFYVRRGLDESPGAVRSVWLHRVGRDARKDTPVFGLGGDARTSHRVALYHGRWLVVSARVGTAPWNTLHLADLTVSPPDEPRFLPIPLAPGALGFARVSRSGEIYLHTTGAAPRGRVRAMAARNLGTTAAKWDGRSWRDVVPEDPAAAISGFSLLEDDGTNAPRLFVVRTRDAASEVTVWDGRSSRCLDHVALPGAGTVRELSVRPGAPAIAWFTYTDYTTAPTVLRYAGPAARTGADRRTTSQATITTRRESYVSADGTEVRIFVMAPASCASGPDRVRPALLTAYGGFGAAVTPSFEPSALAWVEAGGVFAVACVRGGGEQGAAWHRAGMRGHRQNAFDDFHAAAEWLIGEGWTSGDRLGVIGASNAGLLAAVAVTQRRELYRAAVCIAPLADMARYERFGMGPAWRFEYGSVDVPAELDWLMAYSPYHHVVPGETYPSCMFVVFEHDTRVDHMHARKMAAALQHAATGPGTVLFHVAGGLGHQPRSRGKGVAVGADALAFLAVETGLMRSR